MRRTKAELFKVLGVDSRLRIIELLKQRGPLCVCDISKELGITPSAISQHLRILRHAGLVQNRRRGYWIPYELDAAALNKCSRLLTRVCRCGCMDPPGGHYLGPRGRSDELADLKAKKRRLERQLDKIRARIRELEEAET